MKSGSRFVVAIIMVSWCAQSAQAINYHFTDLGTLGGLDSAASGINDNGDVVGSSRIDGQSSATRAFLYSGGVMQNLGTFPGGGNSYAYGISDDGQVVGLAYSNDPYTNIPRAFLYEDGDIEDLGDLTGEFISRATGISAGGDIALSGFSSFGETGESDSYTAILYSGGDATDLGNLDPDYGDYSLSPATTTAGLNDNGQVVGTSGGHAFLYDGDTMQDLGTLPNDRPSDAFAVNANGEVVGVSGGYRGFGAFRYDAITQQPVGPDTGRAFLHDGETMHALGSLAAGGGSAGLGINDNSQIVGWAETQPIGAYPNVWHAFLYEHGVMVDLNALVAVGAGIVLTQANAINNAGQIVGEAAVNGHTHAFLLTPAAPGDLNGDRIVNGQDIALAASNWLLTGPRMADGNDDGIVNGQDIALVAANWLATSFGATSAVPEPGTCGLGISATALLGAIAMRRARVGGGRGAKCAG